MTNAPVILSSRAVYGPRMGQSPEDPWVIKPHATWTRTTFKIFWLIRSPYNVWLKAEQLSDTGFLPFWHTDRVIHRMGRYRSHDFMISYGIPSHMGPGSPVGVSCIQSIIPRIHENSGLPGPVGLGGRTQAVENPYEITPYKVTVTCLRAF